MSLKNAGKNVFEKEDGALEAFRRYLELDEKSEATIRKYMHDVKVFLTFQKGKGSFRKEQIIGYKNWLGERYAVRSANSMLTAVNVVSFLCANNISYYYVVTGLFFCRFCRKTMKMTEKEERAGR